MSHITIVKTEFTDLQSLTKAMQALGYQMKTGGSIRFWNGQTQPVDHSVKLKGPFDIGFVRSSGKLNAACDFYQGHVKAELGNETGPLGKLNMEYAKQKTKSWALSKGLDVTKTSTNKQGELVLEIAGGG